MATLFRRLNHVTTEKNLPRLTTEQIRDLGREVFQKYWATKKPHIPVHHAVFTDESGTYRVVCYPRYFIPVIDETILEYYRRITPRKRRGAPTKVYSVKPSKSDK